MYKRIFKRTKYVRLNSVSWILLVICNIIKYLLQILHYLPVLAAIDFCLEFYALQGHYTQRHFFRNPIKLNWNQILYTIFQLIWNQTDDRLVPNQSENGKDNLISGWFNKISLYCRSNICIRIRKVAKRNNADIYKNI